jgi:cytidine deaminase
MRMKDEDQALLQAAQVVTYQRQLAKDNTAGGVGAALLTKAGNVYQGVCIDVTSGMGFCAEHAAAAAMITAGETNVTKMVAVVRDANEACHIIPPCGRCREFIRQLDSANLDADVVVNDDETLKLRELLPHNEWFGQ